MLSEIQPIYNICSLIYQNINLTNKPLVMLVKT